MRRIKIAKILRNESDFLAKYFLSKLSEISNFNNIEHSWERLNGAWSCGRCVQGKPVLCRRMFTSRGRCFGNCLLVKRFLSYGYFITAGLILDLPLVIARWMDSNGYNLQLYNIYFYTCNKLRRVGCSLLVFIGIVTRDSNKNWKSY